MLDLTIYSLLSLLILTNILTVTHIKRRSTKFTKLSRVLQQTADIVIITDNKGIIEYVNDSFVNITGFSKNDAIGKKPNILSSKKQDKDFYKKLWSTITNGDPFCDVFINKTKNGNYFYEEKTITPIINEGVINGYISTGKDITEQILTRERLSHLSTHDPVTELPNRLFLSNRIEHALNIAQKSEYHIALFVLELDDFSEIKESLGHTIGDQILVEAAKRLKASLFKEDSIARLNDDAFSIMIEKVNNIDEISSIAEKLLTIFKNPYKLDNDVKLYITTSIGIALYPNDKDTPDELIDAARTAMRKAKQETLTSYKFYTQDMNRHVIERLETIQSLRKALDNNEFRLFYQPQVDLITGKIIGLEALLRWQHPEKGLIPPGLFIDILEDHELMIPVGEWVIMTASEQNKQWQNAGLTNICVAVNLSAIQFKINNLVQTIEDSLKKTKLHPEYFEVEITERAIMDNTESNIDTLYNIKNLGVKISIDDFGTGYSSLSYIKRFPIDTIKIDKSFIDNLTQDANNATIAKTIINMAHSLNMTALAEGVETEEQLKYLKSHGCDAFQGYYFSKPLPAEDIEKLLKDTRRLDFSDLDMGNNRNLLIVDDEINIIKSLCRILRRDGYNIYTAHSVDKAFELLASCKINVIISDQRMSGLNGIEFLDRVKNLYPDIVRLLLTGHTDFNTISDAINKGSIYRFLTKPWDDDILRRNIAEAFQYKENYLLDRKIS